MAAHVESMYRAFEPGRNDPCICGSGLKFKKCCAGRYGDSADLEAIRAALSNGQFEDALVLTRAYFTQYVIWHRAHTVPFLSTGSPSAQELLDIDVSALVDLLDWMMECHRQLGELEAFRQTLESVTPLVDHPRWSQKVVYFRALSLLAESWNDKLGRSVLAELGPIEQVDDSEILELYLDLHWGELGVGQRLELIDRIIEAKRLAAVRLQYRSLRGVQLLLVGDRQGAKSEVQAAILQYKAGESGRDDDYGALQLARSCTMLAGLTNDSALLDEAEELLRGQLRKDSYTAMGLAMLWRELGDVLLDQDRAEDAKDAYLRSLDYLDSPLGKLKVSKALTFLGMHDRAREYLQGLSYSELTTAEAFDFNIVSARIALVTGDENEVQEVATRFDQLEVGDPYFKEIRHQVVAELRNPQHRPAEEATGFFAKIWHMASRYLLVQPNLFGVGLNVNAIMKDAVSGSARSKRSRRR